MLAAGAGRTAPEVTAAELAFSAFAPADEMQETFCGLSLCWRTWLGDLAYRLCYMTLCFLYIYN